MFFFFTGLLGVRVRLVALRLAELHLPLLVGKVVGRRDHGLWCRPYNSHLERATGLRCRL